MSEERNQYELAQNIVIDELEDRLAQIAELLSCVSEHGCKACGRTLDEAIRIARDESESKCVQEPKAT